MNKDPLEIVLDTALAHVSKEAEKASRLAYELYRMIEGDDLNALELLAEYGYTDENGEWIFEDE